MRSEAVTRTFRVILSACDPMQPLDTGVKSLRKMKIDGVTYYWLVAAGLLVPFPVIFLMQWQEIDPQSSVALMVAGAVLALVSAICYTTVILDIWDQYRFKLLAFGALAVAATFLIHPYFVAALVFAPYVYWGVRFKGR